MKIVLLFMSSADGMSWLLFKPIKNILLVFFIIKQVPKASITFGQRSFLFNDLSGGKWVIKLLDICIFWIELTQKSRTTNVSHII